MVLLKEKIAKKIYEIGIAILSLCLPFVLLIFLFKIEGFALTNTHGSTIIMFDMQSIYIAFLRNLRDVLINKESFIYTMSKTFGGDYLSIYSFYLASPFNFFVVLFKKESIPLFFLWTMIIKMSFASLNMYLLLRLKSKKVNIAHIGFAVAYGLISYSFVEMNNYMWLDGVMILPLVVLGLKQLEEGRHYWIYIISLAFALMTSWYIGALICMFVILFFLYQFVSSPLKFKQRIPFLVRFVICSLCVGLVSMVAWGTAFIHLIGTKATGGLPKTFDFFSPSMFLTGLLENNYVKSSQITVYSGYISMFTSIVTLIFFQLFFFNKKYTLKNRLTALFLFILYFFIASINIVNAIFHGGQEPTWFPARYSFVIGFIVVYFASLEFEEIEANKWYSLLIPIITMIATLIIVTKIPNSLPKDRGPTLYSISKVSLYIYLGTLLFVTLFYLLNRFTKINKKTIHIPLSLVTIIFISISSYRGGKNVLEANLNDNRYQNYDTYLNDNSYQKDIDNIKSLENYSNFRMEMTFNREGAYNQIDNNPMFYSYNGISHFCSSEKKEVMSYLGKIGFHYNGFFEKYEGGSTVGMNSLFGIKYLIYDENKGNKQAHFINSYPYNEITTLKPSKQTIHYYQNELALPLVFAGNHMNYYYVGEGYRPEGKNSVYWYDHFEYQNQIFKTLCGNELGDIYKPLSINETILSNLSVDYDEHGNAYYSSQSGNGSIRITFTVPNEAYGSNLYFSEKNYYDNCNYMIDGSVVDVSTYWSKGIKGFLDNSSHKHTLIITPKSPINNQFIKPELYYEDISVLSSYVNNLKEQSSDNFIPFKKAYSYGFKGTFSLNKNNQDLYITLPNEGNVTCYIDGEKVETKTNLNIFTGIDLSSYDVGTHEIKWIYRDRGLIISSIGSFIGCGFLVAICIFYNNIEAKAIDRIKKKKITNLLLK